MVYTVLSIILFLGLITGFIGFLSFNRSVEKEKAILCTPTKKKSEKISEKDLEHLPKLMKVYLIKTKIIGKSKHTSVTFTQKGSIKNDSQKKWLSFTATQYMSSHNPGFIWKATSFPMLIRDKYLNLKGEVLVNILGIKKVVQFSGSETNQSSLARYFGELIWFPIGFLDPDISWKIIDTTTIKGVITKGDLSVTGYFYFNENGLITSFKTKRYRGALLENFIGKAGIYRDYGELFLPNTMTAIWDLKDGEQKYFTAKILEYHISKSNC